jgi:hypothetical protein
MRGRDRSEKDLHNTRRHVCSGRREFFLSRVRKEIHGPYPIRVREFDGFGPLGE